jgi:MSHA biogenesis protein MshJ
MLSRQSYALRLLIDRRSMRERLMILLLIGAVVLLLTWAGLRLTGFDKHTVMLNHIALIQADVERYQATLSGLKTARNNPKIIALKNSNVDLQAQLDTLQDRIARIDESLMSPDRMVALLKELLDKQGQLALVSFQVQPVTVIESEIDGTQLFYQHALKLELEGDFDALTAYLAKIEALPTQLFWDAITIQTESFPLMRIELIVHTLSQDKDWLNV